ncbi:MAG: HAMP domain-containing histidine kinase, partial [Saprospiraceae bacterium]|nr:HAMP domain-containing histidine kinase [Saprospiraceae bacterium]
MSKPSKFYQRLMWQLGLLLAAMIVAGTILYTNYTVDRLGKAEDEISKLMGNVVKKLPEGNSYNFELFLQLQENNENLGIILTDGAYRVIDVMNWKDKEFEGNEEFFQNKLEEIKAYTTPIEVKSKNNPNMYINYIYVYNSNVLEELKWFPYLQFILVSIFLILAIWAVRSSKQAEQERVWVGMAKETAHQLGTPISSLIGWIENIRVMYPEDETLEMFSDEMQKDIDMLSMVANRFSKIGTIPELSPINVYDNLSYHLDYIQQRAPRKVTFDFPNTEEQKAIFIAINESLFNWVIENLMKNALDAMGGKGQIGARVSTTDQYVHIDIWDTGKGMPRSNFKKVFQPGFSTKKRGWGLGLSLCKRIVENYHNGKIFVIQS